MRGVMTICRVAIVLATVSLFGSNDWLLRAEGATVVWTGGATGDDRWSTAGNWNSVPAAGSALCFGPVSAGAHISNTNDIAYGTQFAGITFLTGAPSYVLHGNQISLTGPVANQSSNDQEIGLSLNLVAGAGGGTMDADTRTLTISGRITGDASMTKTGSGNLLLSASNTYTGPTAVNAGKLVVDGSLAAASSVTVGSTASVGGAGTISGPVTIAAGAHLAPGGIDASGNSKVGALTAGSVFLGATAVLDWDFRSLIAYDQLVVTTDGGLAITDTVGINLLQEGTQNNFSTPGIYRLIHYHGTLSGAPSLEVLNPMPGTSYAFSTTLDPGWVDLVIFSVPEPSTLALLAAGSLALAGVAWRRKRA